MAKLQGKAAMVTGGGTGIGRGIALKLAQEGAKVVVTGRREEPLKALAAEHESIEYVQSDVTKSAEAKRAVAFAKEKFGKLDLLVNNAGVYLAKPLVEITDDEIDRVFRINVQGLLACSREAVAELKATKGSIVNISSTVSNAALPGHSVYSGTKAAVDHITRTLAAELGPLGIRVNAVAPGLTKTDMTAGVPSEMEQQMIGMTPLGRWGQPEDIAGPVAFLASEDAKWVTGQVLGASGGLLL